MTRKVDPFIVVRSVNPPRFVNESRSDGFAYALRTVDVVITAGFGEAGTKPQLRATPDFKTNRSTGAPVGRWNNR